MSNFLQLVIIAIAILIVIYLFVSISMAIRKRTTRERPKSGDEIMDRFGKTWTYLRQFKGNGHFFFRSPQGRLEKLTIDEIVNLELNSKKDFEALWRDWVLRE